VLQPLGGAWVGAGRNPFLPKQCFWLEESRRGPGPKLSGWRLDTALSGPNCFQGRWSRLDVALRVCFAGVRARARFGPSGPNRFEGPGARLDRLAVGEEPVN
jgi:hypothetical protein